MDGARAVLFVVQSRRQRCAVRSISRQLWNADGPAVVVCRILRARVVLHAAACGCHACCGSSPGRPNHGQVTSSCSSTPVSFLNATHKANTCSVPEAGSQQTIGRGRGTRKAQQRRQGVRITTRSACPSAIRRCCLPARPGSCASSFSLCQPIFRPVL